MLELVPADCRWDATKHAAADSFYVLAVWSPLIGRSSYLEGVTN
jgi:hypothetical protein